MTPTIINAIGKWLLILGLMGAAAYFATHTTPHSSDYAVGCFTAGIIFFLIAI